ncbi:MAG: hypothetical protein LUO93_09285 [Methanomicrobiales archaeon]|nr:hypothetical protein [Methanomicrobiales archaeon]
MSVEPPALKARRTTSDGSDGSRPAAERSAATLALGQLSDNWPQLGVPSPLHARNPTRSPGSDVAPTWAAETGPAHATCMGGSYHDAGLLGRE